MAIYTVPCDKEDFLPSLCTISPEIICIDHRATKNSVELMLNNKKGSDINIDSIKVEGCEGTNSGFLKNGESQVFKVSCKNESKIQFAYASCFRLRYKFKTNISVAYTDKATGLNYKANGTLSTILEKA